MNNSNKVKGHSQINVEMKNGMITVRHTNETGKVLFTKRATNETWLAMFDAIRFE